MISIDRSLLPGGLAPLVITADHTEALWVETYAPPVFDYRKQYAPESPHMSGQALLSAVLDSGELSVVFYARGANWAATQAAMDSLSLALSQFSYPLTLTDTGTTFDAECAAVAWSWDDGMFAANIARGPVSIRLNPPGA